jgi:oligopeptide/dipeptide ABC transporter ATP-binding protein
VTAPAGTTGLAEPAVGAPVLQITGLTVAAADQPDRELVSDVGVTVRAGACSVLVGESGCGKSLTAMSALRMEGRHGGSLAGGRIVLDGVDMVAASRAELRRVRRSSVGVVLQDPGASLVPVTLVGHQLRRVIRLADPAERAVDDRAVALLEEVGLPDPRRVLRSYPHELSGGMRQRVVIAMALAGDPRLLVADEPTTALDVSVQARIMDLLTDLMARRRLGILLITHDIAIAGRYSSTASVMYAGQVVESGPTATLLAAPRHPYSRALLQCLPQQHPYGDPIPAIPGRVPLGGVFPTGCRFRPRCAAAADGCRTPQELRVLPGSAERRARCWRAAEAASEVGS